MLKSSPSKNIPLTQFIAHLEKIGIDVLKNYAERNNQFSTKFVIQKIISAAHKQMKDLQKDKSWNEKLVLPVDWIGDQKLDQDLKALTKPYDMENLNFIEATNFGIVLNEYLISCYRSVERKSSSRQVRKMIEYLITLKIAYVTKLKKEYVRVSKES